MATVDRLGWVDSGRGIAISLVVLYHAANWLNGGGVDAPYWFDINEAVSTLRMPLFFALSGLFAGKWLTASWRSLWTSKLSLFLWVFIVWEIIGSAVFQLGLAMKGQCCNLRGTAFDLLISPVAPRFELWFIWALALFFIVAKATRNADWRLQLAVAGALSVVALSGWTTPNVGWSGSAKYYFFFLAGLYLRQTIIRVGAIRSAWALLAIFLGWAAISVVVAVTGVKDVPGLYFLNCVAGVLGGIALSRLVLRVRLLSALGRQTLPIYLAHTPFVIVISFLLTLDAIGPGVNAVAPIVPLAVAAAAIALAVTLHRLALRSGLRYLYEPPDRFSLKSTSPAAKPTQGAPG